MQPYVTFGFFNIIIPDGADLRVLCPLNLPVCISNPVLKKLYALNME